MLLAPNSQQTVDGAAMEGTFPWRLRFSPHPASAMAFLPALALMTDVKEFVYFQF